MTQVRSQKRNCFIIKLAVLNVDLKRPIRQNLPLFKFSKKWIISCLAGSASEVRDCLLTWAGISLKAAQSNCTFEVTHITDGTVNIAPTRLGTFLQSLLYFPFPSDENYIICHKRFIKRGQASISSKITHAITLIIPPCLICIIWHKNVGSPWEMYFTATSGTAQSWQHTSRIVSVKFSRSNSHP